MRSPHPHARIVRIDATRALALRGVQAVVTGKEIAELIAPVPAVVKAPIAYYPIAVDRVRYVGEPVAVVVADTRYIAEDACDLIVVEYDVLPAVADLAACHRAERAADPRQGRIERRSAGAASDTAIRTPPSPPPIGPSSSTIPIRATPPRRWRRSA